MGKALADWDRRFRMTTLTQCRIAVRRGSYEQRPDKLEGAVFVHATSRRERNLRVVCPLGSCQASADCTEAV